jgi:dihydrofolate reductase
VSFAIIVAADEANGIGKDGALPWHLPGDMAFFKRTTISAPEGKTNFVIMGRKTYESIPKKFRPLKERRTIVLSRSLSYGTHGGTLVTGMEQSAESLEKALKMVSSVANVHRVFVIGGAEVYGAALERSDCAQVLLTRVHARFDCDTRLPAFEHAFVRTDSDGPHRDGEVGYTFETYARRS